MCKMARNNSFIRMNLHKLLPDDVWSMSAHIVINYHKGKGGCGDIERAEDYAKVDRLLFKMIGVRKLA